MDINSKFLQKALESREIRSRPIFALSECSRRYHITSNFVFKQTYFEFGSFLAKSLRLSELYLVFNLFRNFLDLKILIFVMHAAN